MFNWRNDVLRKSVNMTKFFRVAGSVNDFEPPSFLQTATSVSKSVVRKLIPNMLILELLGYSNRRPRPICISISTFSITPTELFGAAIGILIVFRTNAGHDRWWEARKVWGES